MRKKLIKKEINKTYVYLIRHAHWIPPKGPHTFDPHYPLSKKGRIQAKALAKRLSPLKDEIDMLVCSSQGRAVETAKEVSKLVKQPLIKSDSFWELNNIFWTRKYYKKRYWKNYFKHKKSMLEFNNLLKKNQGKVIIIVAHGNIIKDIIKNKYKMPTKSIKALKDLDYKNCHISLLKFKGTRLERIYCMNSKEVIFIKRDKIK